MQINIENHKKELVLHLSENYDRKSAESIVESLIDFVNNRLDCKGCGRLLPHSAFYKGGGSKKRNGKSSTCKICYKAKYVSSK